jgi:hypothetical protein
METITTTNQRLSPETQRRLSFGGSVIANQLVWIADELETIRRADYAGTIDHAEFVSSERSLRQAINELLSIATAKTRLG